MVFIVLFSVWICCIKFGIGLVVICEDEGKAVLIGVNIMWFKVVGYVVSVFFIGVAGGVYVYYLMFLNLVGLFVILGSVVIVLVMFVGGKGMLYGLVIGVFVV